jgi:activator of 2-hydroxyglutaryl-CoA dehydratase
MLFKLYSDAIIFTGGVAKNRAIIKILESETGAEVILSDYPQYNGAIGCCYYGEKQ